MNKLLNVLCGRLFRDKIFYLALAATFGISLFIVFDSGASYAGWAAAGDDCGLEDFFFNFCPLLGMMYSAFACLFLGIEHADGTLRNKLIAGHSRTSIFCSMFLTAALGCLLITAVWLLASLPGFLFFRSFGFGWSTFAQYLLGIFAVSLFYAAVLTVLSLLIPNRAVSSVAALLLWIALLFSGSAIVNLLAAPEQICDYVLEGNQWVMGELHPNPDYISGTRRQVMTLLANINPVCTSIQIADDGLEKPVLQLLYTLGSSAIVLLAGILAFRKKDLK